jgi:hypothetical protein
MKPMRLLLFGVVLLAAVPVWGQTGSPEGQTLTLRASAGGGYDDDVLSRSAAPSQDPRARSAGSYGSTDLGLDYSAQGRRVTFGATANAAVRAYRASENVTADNYSGSAGVSVTLSPRFRAGVTAAASRYSHYILWLFPAVTESRLGHVPLPSMDYSITRTGATRYMSGAELSYSPTTRSTASFTYARSASRGGQHIRNLDTQAWGGGYRHGFTRYAALRLGVLRQVAQYENGYRVPLDSYDIGVDYSRPLSFSRRTTVKFRGGSAVIGRPEESGSERKIFTATGQAGLNHRLGRAWQLDAAYNRGVGLIDGFEEPVLADSVALNLLGTLRRRVVVGASAGYSNGTVGLRSRSDRKYASYTGSAETQLLLHRRLSAYAEYVYYHYEFDPSVVLPEGSPRRLNRQGVRGGLVFTIPIL